MLGCVDMQFKYQEKSDLESFTDKDIKQSVQAVSVVEEVIVV